MCHSLIASRIVCRSSVTRNQSGTPRQQNSRRPPPHRWARQTRRRCSPPPSRQVPPPSSPPHHPMQPTADRRLRRCCHRCRRPTSARRCSRARCCRLRLARAARRWRGRTRRRLLSRLHCHPCRPRSPIVPYSRSLNGSRAGRPYTLTQPVTDLTVICPVPASTFPRLLRSSRPRQSVHPRRGGPQSRPSLLPHHAHAPARILRGRHTHALPVVHGHQPVLRAQRAVRRDRRHARCRPGGHGGAPAAQGHSAGPAGRAAVSAARAGPATRAVATSLWTSGSSCTLQLRRGAQRAVLSQVAQQRAPHHGRGYAQAQPLAHRPAARQTRAVLSTAASAAATSSASHSVLASPIEQKKKAKDAKQAQQRRHRHHQHRTRTHAHTRQQSHQSGSRTATRWSPSHRYPPTAVSWCDRWRQSSMARRSSATSGG